MSDKNPWTDILGFTDLGTDEREQTLDEVKELIKSLGNEHPEVFEDWDIDAGDYQRELKDAIFSLGGTFRQTHGADNEDIVREVFLEPAEEQGHLSFTDQRGSERIDFKGRLKGTEDIFAMDVKGGEGQSIGHLLVPTNTNTLMLWSERNARNTKSPSSRLNEVINRAVRWGLNQDEDPRYMIIRDPPAGARTENGRVIPDVIVFPNEYPSPNNPDPKMPALDDLHFAEVLFKVTTGIGDLNDEQCLKHVWWHEMRYDSRDGGKIDKNIYNAYDNGIELRTQAIDYSRISDVA
ncbi:hypothetical protein C482_16388 [Natrialba chahannaoensis JCM 10990]|uniref:Uncharacterized protein n=1 Tax=Natrialba chahannaoensis JCM 10990 TaxID=1227492 RepID=M0AAZ2_9EURY|nr:hypothetical protein [Natrialba chahannaoensis]ELY95714.1 hypothetical protein C482_16388 [Natrialba chahannaoensis JCM 10990]